MNIYDNYKDIYIYYVLQDLLVRDFVHTLV